MVCSIGRLYTEVENYIVTNSYYIENGGSNKSQWYGRGAALLGLSGEVKAQEYDRSYKGLDLEGNPLRQQQTGKKINPGRDITLSAPKSVSIVILLKGDLLVLVAHEAAVRAAMDYVEKNCIFTRTGKGGVFRQQTDNATIAIFPHHDNRNNEPQIHSHCVIFNQTIGADGKWRSMDNRELYQQKMTIGMVYHYELGRRLKELGYQLEWNHDGTFEIAGYTQQQLKAFSTRRSEIIAAVGMDASTAVKAKACTITRKSKSYKTVEEGEAQRESWQQRAEALGIVHPKPEFQKNFSHQLLHSTSKADLLKGAIKVTSDRSYAFPRHVLLREMLTKARGNYSLEELEQLIDSDRNLVKTADGRLSIVHTIGREDENSQNFQQPNPQRKEIADAIAAPNLEQVYQRLQEQENIKQISIDSKRLQAVANDYFSRERKKQTKTLILGGTDADKQTITSQIREGLIKQGQLGLEVRKISVLKPKNLDKFGITQASSYKPGEVVKFSKNSAKFSQDLYYRIERVDDETNTVILKDEYDTTQTLELNKYKEREVFEVEIREIRPGERMKFTRNCERQNQINGQYFTVVGFTDEKQASVRTRGKTRTVNIDAMRHSDYSYADTVQSDRGKTTKHCIYVASSSLSPTEGKKNFSIAASRTREELVVYTAKIEDLGFSMQQFESQEKTLPSGAKQLSEQRPTQSPTRKQEFKLLVQCKYLVEEKGEFNPQNNKEKIYRSADGTEIKLNGDRLKIAQGNSELEFDRDNATVKNTFSLKQMQEQIKTRTAEANHLNTRERAVERSWSIGL
ncbi:MAG: relaxase domain-containing protein [Hydrococcus sp. Prado102]|jgi:conjugative relaxase-like TrwC/TraI family protein|nr:relaxase domain-containing protein [Hydrococcus sp. Prado102]